MSCGGGAVGLAIALASSLGYALCTPLLLLPPVRWLLTNPNPNPNPNNNPSPNPNPNHTLTLTLEELPLSALQQHALALAPATRDESA